MAEPRILVVRFNQAASDVAGLPARNALCPTIFPIALWPPNYQVGCYLRPNRQESHLGRRGQVVFRCLTVTIAVVLAMPGQSAATINIWLSGTGTIVPGSSFPLTAGAVPVFEPYLGGSGTVHIWGRPDAGKSLENVSLNLVAQTQPCTPTCVTPGAIAFTSATLYNAPFPVGMPSMVRFEYVDDSTSIPPLPIDDATRIEGLEGLTILNEGTFPAVGIGSAADSRYDAAHNSWLIAEVDYEVLAMGENTDTHLFLEIGPIGLNHTGEATAAAVVVFGHATDTPHNGDANRSVHMGAYDARISPRPFPGDSDRNGAVELADYLIWRASFGSTTLLAADHNLNGVVDAADHAIWRNNLGLFAGSGGAIANPEPSAVVSALIALMALLAVCRLPLNRAK